jgi:PAS domain S-box-containing protein
MVYIEPLQYYLVIPKAIESVLFLVNVILGYRIYHNNAWKERPLFHRLLIVGMAGWFIYITLDIFIYLLAPVSMEGVKPAREFRGYPMDYPSLFYMNILRDMAMAGAIVTLWCYFFAALNARYGEVKITNFMRKHPILTIIISVFSILIIVTDTIVVNVKDTGVQVNAAFTGLSGIFLFLTIIMYLIAAVVLLLTLRKTGTTENQENPQKLDEKKIAPKKRSHLSLGIGILLMSVGNAYWVLLGIIQSMGTNLFTSPLERLYTHFLGHIIWAISPIFIYYGLRAPLDLQLRNEDFVRIGLDKFRTYVEESLLAVYIVKNHQIIYANKYMAKLLEYEKDQIETWKMDNLYQIIHPNDLLRVKQIYEEKAITEQTRSIIEFRISTKTGEVKWVQHYSQPFIYNRERLIQSVFLDITEQKQWEEKVREVELQTQKIESIALLAGGIAHDYNNLLSAIIGNIDLLKLSKDFDDDIKDALQDTEQAALQAHHLTTQLLTFSRGGAPIKITTSIPEIIKESAAFVLRGSKSQFEITAEDNLPPADIDVGQFNQVLNNLIINADQAMPEGGYIEISVNKVEITKIDNIPIKAGIYLKMNISDNGPGIAPEHYDKMFVPYFTTKSKGSGLGLATSFSIIKRHDGYIKFHSELGKGTTFSIFLPASSTKDSKKEKLEKPSNSFVGDGRILIMDDDEKICRFLKKTLESLGFQADSAEDGDEAIEKYKTAMHENRPFKAVIMDLTIPGGMGGKETIKRLVEIDPNVVAIVSSGYSNDPIMSDYQRYNFKGVLAKPYTIDTLREIFSELFS